MQQGLRTSWVVAFGLLLVAGFVLLRWLSAADGTALTAQEAEIRDNDAIATAANGATPSTTAQGKPAQASADDDAVVVGAGQTDMSPERLWGIDRTGSIDIASLPELSSVRLANAGERHVVQLHASSLRALRIGRQLVVPLVDGRSETLSVTAREQHENGDVSVVARTAASQAQPEAGSIIVTVGKGNTYATLRGGLGAFEMVGNESAGWLFPSSELGPIGEEGMLDYVVPKRVHASNTPRAEPLIDVLVR